MNQEIKALWVAALRSGDYKQQTNGVLCDINPDTKEEKWCCLGVLTDLYVKLYPEELIITNENNRYKGYRSPNEIMENAWYLHGKVKDWAGLKSTGGNFEQEIQEQNVHNELKAELEMKNKHNYLETGHLTMSSLALVNDNGCSFSEIAQIIEKCF